MCNCNSSVGPRLSANVLRSAGDICWLSAGILYWNFASDPRTIHQERMKRQRQGIAATSGPSSLQDLLQDVKGVVTVPSFLVVASQGVVGAARRP